MINYTIPFVFPFSRRKNTRRQCELRYLLSRRVVCVCGLPSKCCDDFNAHFILFREFPLRSLHA